MVEKQSDRTLKIAVRDIRDCCHPDYYARISNNAGVSFRYALFPEIQLAWTALGVGYNLSIVTKELPGRPFH